MELLLSLRFLERLFDVIFDDESSLCFYCKLPTEV